MLQGLSHIHRTPVSLFHGYIRDIQQCMAIFKTNMDDFENVMKYLKTLHVHIHDKCIEHIKYHH